MTEVVLSGEIYAVALPSSFTDRADAQDLLPKASTRGARVCGALIGFCVPGLGLTAKASNYDYHILEWGGAVLDELVSRGATPAEVSAAAVSIARELAGDFVTDKEVNDRVDFSEPSGEV